ncbi:MAG TPA: hypothetical protein VHZ54_13650 [Solirubrobacterales bacterium]|jgi:hypothetical protein|nr:hypothetical protein [Solirubrobacterales bacterium]
MTNSHPHPNPPTTKQLRYLRDLAVSRGQTFVVPTTSAEASAEIGRLRERRGLSRGAKALEHWDDRAIEDRWAPATDIRPEEIEGYGSTARWAR